jgi:translation initiation factor IF-2
VLVQNGTLHLADSVLVGEVAGKIRAMFNEFGEPVKEAGPATPVEILGLDNLPEAGDTIQAVEDDKLARHVADKRLDKRREEEMATSGHVSLDELFAQVQEGDVQQLNIVLKADVQGSAEAVRQALERLSTDEVKVKVIHSAAGAISDSDVMLATASKAIIIGFNVRPDSSAKKLAEREQVEIRLYRVIYDAIENVKAAMAGMLKPEEKEVTLGQAAVRAIFKVPKVGVVAGCYVTEGKALRSALVRVIRDGIVVYEGKLNSLKRFKDDAREVTEGYECGIGIERFNDLKEGDVLEFFQLQEVGGKQTAV